MPEAEVTIQGLPEAFARSLEAARDAAMAFAAAEAEIRAQSDKTAKQIAEELKALEKSERARRKGLTTSERTIAALVDEERALKETAKSARLSEQAQASLATKGMDQLRRETANAGRSLSMLFDAQNKHLDAILKEQEQIRLFAALQADANEAVRAGTATIQQQIIVQAESAETADDILKAYQRLEFETSDLSKGTDEYKAVVKALTDRLKGLQSAGKDAADGYENQKQKLDSLETAMDALGVPGASLVMRGKQIADSFETMAERGTKAELAMLKGAVALGAVGAAAAAAVAGAAAIAAAITTTAAKTAEWDRDLRKVGLGLDKVAQEKAVRAEAAVGAFGASLKRVGTAVGSTFAPALTSGATLLTAFNLAAVDAWNNLASGKTAIRLVSEAIATVFIESITVGVTALEGIGKAMAAMGGAAGATGQLITGAFSVLGDEIDQLKQVSINALAASLEELAEDGWDPLIGSVGDYMAQAEGLIGRQAEINAGIDKGTASLKAYTDAVIERDAMERAALEAIAGTEIDLLTQRREARAAADAEATAALQAYTAAALDLMRQEAEARVRAEAEKRAAIQATTSVARTAAGNAMQLANMIAGETSAAYKIIFGVAQGLALSQIAFDTIVGFNKALASQQYVQAGLIAANGIASAAVVAATAYGQFRTPGASAGPATGAGASQGQSATASAAVAASGVVGGDAGTRKPTTVSDAYIPATGGPRTLALTDGDEGVIMRGGPMGFSEALRAMVSEIQGLRGDIGALGRLLRDDRTDQRLRAAMVDAGPPRRH